MKQMQLNVPARDTGIDLLKLIAMMMVPALHFCLYGGFYHFPHTEKPMLAIASVRMLMYQCVPLFLIISGYLLGKAQFCAKHYIKLIPLVLNSYIVGLITILYKVKVCHETWPTFTWFQTLWQMNQPSYGWYISMYIALFMIVPFINLVYKALNTPQKKLWALFVIILGSNFAITVNRFKIHRETGDVSLGFVPNQFSSAWPIAYYWTGMLIHEYKPKVKKWMCALAVALLVTGEALLNYCTSPDTWYNGITLNNEDFANVIVASLLFLLLYDVNIRGKITGKIISTLASASMTFYLVSWMCDSYYVRNLLKGENSPMVFIRRFFCIIPLEIVVCLAIAVPLNLLIKIISKQLMKPLFRLADRWEQKEAPPQAKQEPAKPTPVEASRPAKKAAEKHPCKAGKK